MSADKKPSKMFSITKKPYKKVYRFLGIKWVRHNRFAEILDLIRKNQSDTVELMRKNQTDVIGLARQNQRESVNLIQDNQSAIVDLANKNRSDIVDLAKKNYSDMVDLLHKNQSESVDLMHQNQKELEYLNNKTQEYENLIKQISVKDTKKPSRFDIYKPKLNDAGYSVEKIDGKIRIWDDTLIIEGEADNTLWTSDGVLCSDEYHFDIDKKYVMFDIGLNLGITSLHKARDKNCVKIYGYEPFVPTFQQAQNNMNLNPELSKKISIFDYGLGDTDKELDVNYNPERPGAMSSVKNVFPECEKIEKIRIKKSSDILGPLFKKHKESIFLKIDCEGAEKEILPDLDKAGLLTMVDIIVMEWHFENPKWIINLLKKNNFVVFCKNDVPNKLGIIRAYRKS